MDCYVLVSLADSSYTVIAFIQWFVELVTFLWSYQRIHAARPVGMNSFAFLITGNVISSFFSDYFSFHIINVRSYVDHISTLSSSSAVYDLKFSPNVAKLSGMYS